MGVLTAPAMPHALHGLYHQHHGWLHGWLRRRLGCTHLAADLAHDTYLRLLHRPVDWQPGRDPRGLLSTVAHGLLVDHRRRQAIEQAYLQALAARRADTPLLAPSPEQRAIVIETLVEVETMLARLPERPRRAFLLAQWHEQSYAAIAIELGVSERMVKKYVAQAMLHCLRLSCALDEALA